MNKIVCFDVDGVLADFEGKLVNVLESEFGDIATKNRNLFSIEDRFENHPEIIRRAQLYINTPNFYRNLEPIKDMILLANELIGFKVGVMYLTSRPQTHEEVTRRWLQKHTENYSESLGLFCGVENKADFLLDVNAQYLIDDNPKEITRCKKSKIPVLVWSQEWNERLFPRLYASSNGTLMLWESEDKEAEPFWTVTY